MRITITLSFDYKNETNKKIHIEHLHAKNNLIFMPALDDDKSKGKMPGNK